MLLQYLNYNFIFIILFHLIFTVFIFTVLGLVINNCSFLLSLYLWVHGLVDHDKI